MREKPEAQEWYFFKAGSDAGLKAGPFSWERLLSQAQGGTLEPTDVVWDPNSGWKTAAQVPGLFPTVAAPGAASPGPEAPAKIPFAPGGGRSRLYWLSALVALVVVGGALGAYFGLRDGGEPVATSIALSTTQSSATTQSTATTLATPTTQTSVTTQSTTAAVTVTSDVSASPVKYLDKTDSGHEVVLHVGDRVRIDLKPWKGDKLKSVLWEYRSNAVRETGSDSQTVNNAVVASWLELQAVSVGPVTVRAKYQYPDGTYKSMWVVYLFVE